MGSVKDTLDAEEITKEILKRGAYAERFLKYFGSLNLQNVRPIKCYVATSVWPGIMGVKQMDQELIDPGTDETNSFYTHSAYKIGIAHHGEGPVVMYIFHEREGHLSSYLYRVGFNESGLIALDGPIFDRGDIRNLGGIQKGKKFLELVENAYQEIYE